MGRLVKLALERVGSLYITFMFIETMSWTTEYGEGETLESSSFSALLAIGKQMRLCPMRHRYATDHRTFLPILAVVVQFHFESLFQDTNSFQGINVASFKPASSITHARTTPSSPVVTIISSSSYFFPESNRAHQVT